MSQTKSTKKTSASQTAPEKALSRPEIVKSFQTNPKDTGSPEVQAALLTDRLKTVSLHIKANPKDLSSQRGLMRMVNLRKRHLAYLKKVSLERYQSLIHRLELRH